ncbi:hypothetical protein TNCV_4574541 [Trichonephila clavipes]|nr:hypothetical protein TNCV_4574541 [Trichonephila clavipes]
MPVGDANRNNPFDALRVSLSYSISRRQNVLISSHCAALFPVVKEKDITTNVSFLATGQREEITSSRKSMTSKGSVLMESALRD